MTFASVLIITIQIKVTYYLKNPGCYVRNESKFEVKTTNRNNKKNNKTGILAFCFSCTVEFVSRIKKGLSNYVNIKSLSFLDL